MARKLALPPGAPWTDVAFVGAYWNCEQRLKKLLAYVRPWFTRIVCAVQESPDDTLAVAREYADEVIEEPWYGNGDVSLAKAVARAERKWSFVISDDEWPSVELLGSFQDLVEAFRGHQGAWFHFRSFIDGIEFTSEQDWHLRFFESWIGWPGRLHSRPPAARTIHWRPTPEAVIMHRRSLDEMVRDYLRYIDLETPADGEQLRAHNRMMIRDAVAAIAARKGEDYVASFPWFERVKELGCA